MKNSSQIKVTICMATYFGGEHLKALLRTLENQTGSEFEVIVRDDGSKDCTRHILNSFASESRHVVKIIDDRNGNLGPENNFLETLKNASGELILFCDQDDLWSCDKVETFRVWYNAWRLRGKSAILFSDYLVFDDRSEYTEGVKLDLPLRNLLFENFIPGCCMGITKVLAKKVIDVGGTGLMHDWSATLVNLAAGGEFIRIPLQLTRYRQHDRNVVGYSRVRFPNFNFAKYLANAKKVRSVRQKLGIGSDKWFLLFLTWYKVKKFIFRG